MTIVTRWTASLGRTRWSRRPRSPGSDVNKDLTFKAKDKDLTFKAKNKNFSKAKAKCLTFKAKAKALISKAKGKNLRFS